MTVSVREYIWTPWDQPGNEHLRLHVDDGDGGDGRIQADSQIVMIADAADDRVLRVSYRIELDASWRVRSTRIASEQPDGSAIGLVLQADGRGNWTDGGGMPLHELDGCVDVDIQATPFTNTLPIRRLALEPHQQETIRVAYVRVPSLDVSAEEQRYTGLADGRVRYESIETGFTRDLDVDRDGSVVTYHGLFRRVWPRRRS